MAETSQTASTESDLQQQWTMDQANKAIESVATETSDPQVTTPATLLAKNAKVQIADRFVGVGQKAKAVNHHLDEDRRFRRFEERVALAGLERQSLKCVPVPDDSPGEDMNLNIDGDQEIHTHYHFGDKTHEVTNGGDADEPEPEVSPPPKPDSKMSEPEPDSRPHEPLWKRALGMGLAVALGSSPFAVAGGYVVNQIWGGETEVVKPGVDVRFGFEGGREIDVKDLPFSKGK